MVVVKFTPLEEPLLDPRNETELVARALDLVYAASNGRLNDFSSSSPARALIEGQAFSAAELLYYANKLPLAMAISFLKIAGIQQKLGSAAQATLTFTLSTALGSAFVLPQAYAVKSDNGSLTFETDALLTIPAGAISADVSATCTEIGSKGNVGAYTLRQLTQPLAFLQSVTNTAAATGGTDGESLDDTRSRAFAAIRRRGLISADDYEQEAQAILGAGSVAHCIGNLSADATTLQRGAVHVFVLNPDGGPLNQAQLNTLNSALTQKAPVAIAVYCSNIEIVQIEIFAVVALTSGTNSANTAAAIWQALQAYLTPGNLPLGETILVKEVEFLIRNTGVSYIQSVTLGYDGQPRLSTNLPLPHDYSAAKITSFGIDLVEGSTTYTYAFGEGDPD